MGCGMRDGVGGLLAEVYCLDQRGGERNFTDRPIPFTTIVNNRADVVSNICTSQKKLKPNANVLSYCMYLW